MLAVLYLVFNEGYGRPDDQLAARGARLARLLVDLMPDEDEARGLLALVTFQLARRATRFDADGDLVPMEEQDRSQWDTVLIEEGRWHCAERRPAAARRAPTGCRPRSPHATRPPPTRSRRRGRGSSRSTTGCSPPSRRRRSGLNRAIAIGFRDGYDAGLAELDSLERSDGGVLRGYYLLPAARADFHRRAGRRADARRCYEEALALVVPEGAEARLIRRRLAELDASA